MILLNRRTRMIFFGIILGTLTLASWTIFSLRNLNECRFTPAGDLIRVPEPELQGMSVDETLMHAYLAQEFSNDTYIESSLQNSSKHQIIFYLSN